MAQLQDSSDCCINSKHSSAEKGYFKDEYLSVFTKKLRPRSPIINRGYYIRFKALEEIFHSWWSSEDLSLCSKFQIISLGAGNDSSYFRLKNCKKLPPNCFFVEIDFLEVLSKKLEYLQDLLPKENSGSDPFLDPAIVYHSDEYAMLGADLREVEVVEKLMNLIGVDFDAPTLFVAECSITYIHPKHSEELIVWIKKNFLNSAFVTYEQVYPDDAFGIIMRNHFSSVGCPLKSIIAYPNEESQVQRFQEMGWNNCQAVTIYDFFNSLPLEEKERIKQLELFDEYEMWHEKCHHYILTGASQGLLCTAMPQSLRITNRDTEFFKQNVTLQGSFTWNSVAANELVQRFSHQVVSVTSSLVVVSGGFGMSEKKHQKLDDILLYNVQSEKHLSVHNTGNPRMFHTMTKLSSDILVLLGGRNSPTKIYDEVLIIHFFSLHNYRIIKDFFSSNSNIHHSKKGNLTVTVTYGPHRMPLPVWRHSATAMFEKRNECIVVFGGCSVDNVVSNQCYVLHTKTWLWTEINVQDCTPSARHSHSAVPYKDSRMLVSGGLSSDETILRSVHELDLDQSSWSTLQVAGLLPRYSHTSHVWNNHLFLVGGVTSISHYKLGVGIVNLQTLQAFEVCPPAQDPEYPILLCNHMSFLQDDEIVVLGGGGNCFSFGTHFNKKIVSFSIKALL